MHIIGDRSDMPASGPFSIPNWDGEVCFFFFFQPRTPNPKHEPVNPKPFSIANGVGEVGFFFFLIFSYVCIAGGCRVGFRV